jgi:hypothetical protein
MNTKAIEFNYLKNQFEMSKAKFKDVQMDQINAKTNFDKCSLNYNNNLTNYANRDDIELVILRNQKGAAKRDLLVCNENLKKLQGICEKMEKEIKKDND